MEHPEIYEEFCKDRFDKIEAKQDEILAVLKGDNGNAGLCERTRKLESTHKIVWGSVIFVISITFIQVVEYIAKKLT